MRGARFRHTTRRCRRSIGSMNLLSMALAVSLAGTPNGAPADARPGLELKPKAALIAEPHASAPFVMPAEQPHFRASDRADSHTERSPSACESDRSLCYDAGHIVFKPARRFLPEIPGLQRERESAPADGVRHGDWA